MNEFKDIPMPSFVEKGVMHWYHETSGGHTHIRVFMNGGKAGDLCFTNDEFEQIRREANRSGNIKFHKQTTTT